MLQIMATKMKGDNGVLVRGALSSSRASRGPVMIVKYLLRTFGGGCALIRFTGDQPITGPEYDAYDQDT